MSSIAASFGLRLIRNTQQGFETRLRSCRSWRLDLIAAAEDAAANTELLEADYHSASNREWWDNEIFTILFCREFGLSKYAVRN